MVEKEIAEIVSLRLRRSKRERNKEDKALTLSHQTNGEPSGLKEQNALVDGRFNAVVEVEVGECKHIENGGDRTEKEHEDDQVPQSEDLWPPDVLFIYIVERHCGLREIVEQIL